MSKISAKSGGSLIDVQLPRNQFRCAQCLAPSARISGTLASSAGIICIDVRLLGRDRTIWTRSASAMCSLTRDICFGSDMPGRLDESRTRAEKSPISVSLSPSSFRPFEKFWKAVTKSFCEQGKERLVAVERAEGEQLHHK